MKQRTVFVAAAIASALVCLAAGSYIWIFGARPNDSQAAWGQFGDFFGGLLNPIFALLAFLAVLWSMAQQDKESRETAALLTTQVETARKELSLLQEGRLSEELLHVVKDIDQRIEFLLKIDISEPGTHPRLNITHMVSESERVQTSDCASPAYDKFITQARTPGTVVEAPVREIIYLVEKMREFLSDYSQLKDGAYTPVIVYYADKVFQLLHMLEHIGGLPSDTRQFFAKVGDPHG
jgi:hypothetical protein